MEHEHTTGSELGGEGRVNDSRTSGCLEDLEGNKREKRREGEGAARSPGLRRGNWPELMRVAQRAGHDRGTETKL